MNWFLKTEEFVDSTKISCSANEYWQNQCIEIFFLIWSDNKHKHNFIFKTILIISSLFLGTHILFIILHYKNKQNNHNSITHPKKKTIVKNPRYSYVKEHIDSWIGNPDRLHIDYKSILKWDRSIFKAAMF